jgi:tripartite-type tricarboxylate transporter receptor subunit TctC
MLPSNNGEEIMTATRMVAAIAVLCLAAFAAERAEAQTYPDKPIKIIVPAASGGPTDIPARLASQILQPKWGQPVVIENRPGAGGGIGARAVIASPADGYTLLAGNTSVLAVYPAVAPAAGYDPIKNFAPVAKVSESYQILVVSVSSPWKTVKDWSTIPKPTPARSTWRTPAPAGCRI